MQLRGSQLEPGSIIGGYRIDELMSRGGMGIVYSATNIALNRIYALKVLAPELADDDQFRQRFKREMQIAASLNHPNVVGIHYAGEHDGRLFLAMDLVDGTDLGKVLRREGALAPDRAVGLLMQVTSALDAAHGKGLVHRDVKPANVLISVKDGKEHADLTDFGLAKRFDTATAFTAKGLVVGTVDYMPPEQITGGHTDARTDVYALGCVLFQMLTAKVPYERENSVATLFAHVYEPPPPLEGPLADLYPSFGPVIAKAMAKETSDRYLSAGDFARDATAALSGVRYTGPSKIVATGEAKPLEEAAAGAGSHTTIRAALENPAHAEPTRIPSTARQSEPQITPPNAGADTQAAQGPAAATIVGERGRPQAGTALRKYRWPALAILALLGGTIAAIIALTSGASPTVAPGQRFATAAAPVPSNRVTGSGTASVQLNGDLAKVTVTMHGLLNGSPHALHIHAGGQGVCPSASAARLHNGHLSISTTDGIKFYGPPVTSLTSTGDTSPKSIIDFTRYPSVGNLRYTRTLIVTPEVAAAIRASNAVIVVHGIDYNGNGIYDNVLDRSELNNSLPGEATAPALCGPLAMAQNVAARAPRRSRRPVLYTASLGVHNGAATEPLTSWFLCHVARSAASATVPRTLTDSVASTGA